MPRKSRRPATEAARRAVGYVRASTDEQHLGPVAQREALARWCADNDTELVTVCEDLGVSGGAPLDKRPGLLAAVDALAELEAGVLLVAKRDRLARDTMTAAMVERLADRTGAKVRTADGTGNGDSPEDMLMRRMVDAFAEYERALIRTRTRAALAVKKARGEKTGGDVPYGYRLAADGVHLEAEPNEQRVVSLVRRLRGEGLTLRAIAARLTAEGMKPKGKAWHPNTVARIAKAAEAA